MGPPQQEIGINDDSVYRKVIRDQYCTLWKAKPALSEHNQYVLKLLIGLKDS